MSKSITLGKEVDEALLETMEAMAFTDVERVANGDLEGLAESALWARIDVIEPAAGELVLLVGESLAVDLEEATTGEADGGASVRLDVLGEILNTLAGTWARKIAPGGSATALGIPKMGEGEWAGAAEYEIAVYETDDEERIVLALAR